MARNPKERWTRIFDFSGGLNDTASVLKAQANEALEALNVDLDRDGAVTRRSGATKINATTFGATHELGLVYQFLPSLGSSTWVIAANDYIATLNTGTGAKTNLITGLSANKIFLAVPFLNLLYLFNKNDVPLVYYPGAGSSPYIFRAGMPQPSSSPSAGADAAGSLTAGENFLVRVRFVSIIDDSFIGEPYPEAGVAMTVGASGGRAITGVPVYAGGGSPADYRVAKRVIERTPTTSGTPGADFYEDGIIGDNSTTTYTVGSVDDLTLVTQFPQPDLGTRKPMPNLWPVTAHGRRIIGHDYADQGNIVFSEIDEFGVLPEAFPDENFKRLDVQDYVDDVIACKPLGEYVNFYCGRSIHQLYIDETGVPYSRKLLNHDLGVPSARGVAELPTGHLIWTNRGPYLFDGKQLVFIGERIEELIRNTPRSDMDKMFVMHRSQEFRKQVVFVMPSATSSDENAQRAVYHYRRVTLNPLGFPTDHAWTVHNGFTAKSGYIGQSDATKQPQEITGDYAGFTYFEDTGDSDAHDANGEIDGRFTTIWLDMGVPDQVKYFTDIWLIFASLTSPTLSLVWETTFGEGPTGSRQIAIEASSESQFGTAVFGSAQFARQENRIVHAYLSADGVGAYGKYIRFTISSATANEGFTLAGMIVKWQEERDRNA